MDLSQADREAVRHGREWFALALAIALGGLLSGFHGFLVAGVVVDVLKLRTLGRIYASTTADLSVWLVAVPAALGRYIVMESAEGLGLRMSIALVVGGTAAVVTAGRWLMRMQTRRS